MHPSVDMTEAILDTSSDPLQLSDPASTRPKYLSRRQSSQRFSYSSVASSNTETASDATLGVDYALQSGGARPEPRLHRKGKMTLSRSTSPGSIASGLSALSEGRKQGFPEQMGAPRI